MVRWFILLPISLLLGNLGCQEDENPEKRTHASLPRAEDHFEITDLTLQEGEGDPPLWHAHAQKARGDLQSTRVENVVVTHREPDSNMVVVLNAPHGTISPITHDALLEDAILTDNFHRSVEIKNLRYQRKHATIHGNGPIRLQATNLSLEALSLEYVLTTGRLELAGPVRGQFWPKPSIVVDQDGN